MRVDKHSDYGFEYEYDKYPFLNVPKLEYRRLEYEVSDYSMETIFNKYKLIDSGDEFELIKCSIHRNQMSTMGAYIHNKKKYGIDIVADILTSMKNLNDSTIENRIFKRIYHSVGNIFPVCEGINTRWGGADTAYVKLCILQSHFYNKNCFDKEILDTVRKRIADKMWLGTGICNKGCLKYWIKTEFDDLEWEDYIKKNYLQDMVDKDNNPIESNINEINMQIIKRGYRIMNDGKRLDDKGANDIIEYLSNL